MKNRNIFLVLIAAITSNFSSVIYSKEAVMTAPYGAWKSPLTAASIFDVADNISSLSAENGKLYFIEQQASANGRSILVKLNQDNSIEQITPSDISVRTRVHEYGGNAFLVNGDDIFYSKFSDQKVYRITKNAEAQALTNEGLRYMDCVADNNHKQLICVREDHRNKGEAINTLVAVDMGKGGEGKILFQGTDFVISPALSPDSNKVAFITWSHPNMEWDDTQLRILTLNEDGSAGSVVEVPQTGNVAISKPKFSKDGVLYFLADFEDWRTLYRLNAKNKVESVLDQEIEIVSYAFESNASSVISYMKDGVAHLARVNLNTGNMLNIGESFSSAHAVTMVNADVYFIGSTPSSRSAVYKLTEDSYVKVYSPNGPNIAADYLSTPQLITFPTVADEEAYGFFYPPKNVNFKPAKDTLPPVLVKIHGGPVSATNSTLDPSIQFWTSRGFAVFDVNHRGSTGYGRSFRKKLYPNWGVVDVEDSANGVKWLAEQGLIDPDKTVIRGGSAGGYTTLAALAFQDVFRAGTSYYGISDLEVLTHDTHKYESRFLDQLIGPYPEKKDVYIKRSPINSVNKIKSPLLLLQGLDDEVVPPNQSELIFDALKKNCIPTAYLTFEGEGHGFRQPANNIKSLNAELDFYGQVFGFTPAGDIESVKLERCTDDN